MRRREFAAGVGLGLVNPRIFLPRRRTPQIRPASLLSPPHIRATIPGVPASLTRIHYVKMVDYVAPPAKAPHTLAVNGVIPFGGTANNAFTQNCIEGWADTNVNSGIFFGAPSKFTAATIALSSSVPTGHFQLTRTVTYWPNPNPLIGPNSYVSTSTGGLQQNVLNGDVPNIGSAPQAYILNPVQSLLPLLSNNTEITGLLAGVWYYQALAANGGFTFTAPAGWAPGGLAANQVIAADDNIYYWACMGFWVLGDSFTYQSPGPLDSVIAS